MKKKFFNIILSLGMCMIFSTSAFASNYTNQSNSIEISAPKGVTYETNLIEDNGEEYQEIIINTNRRATGTYETDYDMVGGVFTQQSWNCTATPTFKVTVNPTYYDGVDKNVHMGIYLQKNSTLGFSNVSQSYVTVAKGGSVTLKGNGSGKYRLYFRNYSGYETNGTIYISFSY